MRSPGDLERIVFIVLHEINNERTKTTNIVMYVLFPSKMKYVIPKSDWKLFNKN